MIPDLIVHPHALKHGISEADIEHAWENFVRMRPRGQDYMLALGFSPQGVEIEMVAAIQIDGSFLVIHANTPATAKFKQELGYGRGRR